MARRCAIVNQRTTFFRFQEFGNIGRANFEFERRGHTIKRFHSLARQVLSMLVQINKSRSDHQPFRVNHPPSAHPLGSYPNNLPPTDPNIPHRIQPGLWIHDSSALDHQIVFLRHCGGR